MTRFGGTEVPITVNYSTVNRTAPAPADYREALAAREGAYARNDFVAAAQADQDMQDAVERAIAASEA